MGGASAALTNGHGGGVGPKAGAMLRYARAIGIRYQGRFGRP
jgi:hypothetical protein